MVHWLREHGLQAQAVASRWEGESDEADVVVAEEGGTPAEPELRSGSATDAIK